MNVRCVVILPGHYIRIY
jgi:hypothetical protein